MAEGLAITRAEDFPVDVRQVVTENEVVWVSGRPVWQFGEDGKERFYDDCEEAIEMPFRVRCAYFSTIPEIGYRHVPADYIGRYAVITGVSVETNDEYCFAVKSELHFGISGEAPSQSELPA